MVKKLATALPRIINHFEQDAKRVYLQADLNKILSQNREAWKLPQNTTSTQFIEFILDQTKLKKVTLKSEKYKSIERYTWGEVSAYLIALSVRRDSYLSHGTAVFLHGLTEQIPNIIYANHEQTAKPRPVGSLSQESLDKAFANKQRKSNYILRSANWQVAILNGKQTGNLGIVSMSSAQGESLYLTGLERTLIDIVVRPEYSGGPYQILQAYKSAMSRMSVNALIATLTKLDYVYPFHQAIGFYMQRAGYEMERLERVRRMPRNYDFYLVHGMREKNFDEQWRLYIPKGF